MAELLSTNGNLISTDELSGNTKVSFVAATGITEGYAVRLGEDGKIYPMDSVGKENQPIIGIAQTSGATNGSVDVVIEGGLSTVTSGLLPSYNYYASTNGSISLTGENYIGTALNETTLQVWFGNPNGVVTPSLSVIDNSITDPANITVPGRYIVPVSGLTGSFVGEENDYADYDGTSFTFTLPTNNDKAVITTGPNAGNIYLYSSGSTSGSTSGWTLSTQVTTLTTTNWNSTASYQQFNVVIYQSVLYQANGDVPANTAFVVGTSGATWKQIGVSGVSEYGSITPATQSLVLSATTLVSFVIPSAGVWEIIQSCRSGCSLAGGAVVTFLSTNDNVEISNSKVLHIFINSPGVNVYEGNGTMSTYVTTTGPTTLKLRGQGLFNSASTIYGTGEQYGSSKVSWKKIAGFMPAIGQTTDYIVTQMTGTSQNISAGSTVIYNSIASSNGNIGYDTTTGIYTLRAGITYNITSEMSLVFTNLTDGFVTLFWADADTQSYIPGLVGGAALPTTNNGGVSSVSNPGGIYTPSSNQRIKLVVNSSTLTGTTNIQSSLSRIEIKQIGTTSTSAFTGVISPSWNISNSYPLGTMVINNSNLYQANSFIGTNTAFNIGTTGATWTQISEKTQNWVLGNSYTSGTTVINNGIIYQSNGTIPANTAFSLGTTGATWRQAAADANATWSSGKTYSAGALVVNNNSIYQANNIIPANTPFSAGTSGVTFNQLGVLSGGTAGQFLKKNSSINGDVSWGNTPLIVEQVTITGTGGNPTKGPTTIDKIVLSDYGNGLCSIILNFYQTTSGTAGDGDYLFTLPGGYRFDPSVNPGYVSTGDPLMAGIEAWIPGSGGFLASGGALRMNAYAIVYDETRFRILQGGENIYATNTNVRLPVSSTFYTLSGPNIGIQMAFTFKKL